MHTYHRANAMLMKTYQIVPEADQGGRIYVGIGEAEDIFQGRHLHYASSEKVQGETLP